MRQLHAYYLFHKSPLPGHLSESINSAVEELKGVRDSEEYLRKAYDIVTTRYIGGRVKTFSRLTDLLSSSVEDLWNRSGFMHCTNQNYLLSLLLVRGGHFEQSDISPKWTVQWLFMPHQYLKIRLKDGQYINVDCWARHYGIPFGKFATGFNSTKRRSFAE